MQMWTLGRFLPLVIGQLIPEEDENWENFLCLRDIMDIIFAYPVHRSACGELEALISDHHSSFVELYSHIQITMKMHSIIHTPRLLLKYVQVIAMYVVVFMNIIFSLVLVHLLTIGQHVLKQNTNILNTLLI